MGDEHSMHWVICCDVERVMLMHILQMEGFGHGTIEVVRIQVSPDVS